MVSSSWQLSRGFTLIEVVMAMALLGILVAVGVAGFQVLRGNADITTTVRHIIATLELARNRTVASVDDSQYGVHFASDHYTLFKGATYDAGSADNEVHELKSRLELHDINIGGGNDVIFERLTGNTVNAGTIGVRAVSDPATSSTITILSSGLVGPNDTVTLEDTRLTDTRHLHFDLGTSMQGASNLTLTFTPSSGPTVVETIPMAGYFNTDNSAFDWEGEVTVDGNAQKLRIHTHTLTDSDTLLSVHRDRRFNDVALTVDIDGAIIVSYTASGTATVGGGGGTLTVQ